MTINTRTHLSLSLSLSLTNTHTHTHTRSSHTHTHTHTLITLPHTHHDIDDSEVLLEPMTNKLDSSLQQVDELEVASLERGEVLGADGGIEVTRLDP